MATTLDIVKRGYFPKELPPLFSTKSFASQIRSLPESSKKDSYCLRYSYSKYASVRRTLSIPNPAHFLPLADAISKNWSHLRLHCEASPISKTKPVDDMERAITWETSLDEIPILRAQQRVGARYVLQADVAACYASMYTHAIPWALETKALAKSDRRPLRSKAGGSPLLGNVLDSLSRNIQSGQTIGIPIGPDTSVLIAEIILTEVDKIVVNNLKFGNMAFRFVDDYEFVCETLSEAEQARNILQEALGEYELQLNPRKTQILELPNILDTPWVHELSTFQLESSNSQVLQSQIIRYFNRAFQLTKDNPGEPVLKYASRRLSEVDCTSVSELVQRLLFQAAVIDPGTLQTALYVAFEHRERGFPLDLDAISRALSTIICRHSLLQHGGDIAWALWGAIVFGIQFQEEVIKSLENLTDPIAVLMALFADSKGALIRSITRTQWEGLTTPKELFDRRWIVAYEAVGQDWLPVIDVDPATTDPFFNNCRNRDVHFIDINTPLTIQVPSNAGVYA